MLEGGHRLFLLAGRVGGGEGGFCGNPEDLLGVCVCGGAGMEVRFQLKLQG